MPDYDRAPGVPRRANLDEIRRAYWQLARQHRQQRRDDGGPEGLREVLGPCERPRSRSRSRSDGKRTGRSPADVRIPWFADEVAVDFPSMAGFVRRIQEDFFGPTDPAPIDSAEIRLTAQQAQRGARVPVDVWVRHTCPICGGRGEVWMESCGVCAGSGEGRMPHSTRITVPPGVRHGTRLRYCLVPPYAPSTVVEIRVAVK